MQAPVRNRKPPGLVCPGRLYAGPCREVSAGSCPADQIEILSLHRMGQRPRPHRCRLVEFSPTAPAGHGRTAANPASFLDPRRASHFQAGLGRALPSSTSAHPSGFHWTSGHACPKNPPHMLSQPQAGMAPALGGLQDRIGARFFTPSFRSRGLH